MDRKKVCKKSSAKKKMMSIELKREIIEKHEQGVRVVDLSRQYGRSTSMICSVLKRKESIKCITPAKGLTIISKLRTSLHENMEKLLMVWVTEKQLQGDTLTQTIICEKARAIYGDLLKQTPQTSIDEASEESFKASRGWFENFKNRSDELKGREKVNDDQHTGRPRSLRCEENKLKIKELIKSNRRISIKDLSSETGLSVGLCHQIVTEDSDTIRTSSKFVPRILTEEQKENLAIPARNRRRTSSPALTPPRRPPDGVQSGNSARDSKDKVMDQKTLSQYVTSGTRARGKLRINRGKLGVQPEAAGAEKSQNGGHEGRREMTTDLDSAGLSEISTVT
ncbi:hypothetical protein LAZ67_22000835 [Cordylochernes scorpioides]|uniref:HTH CENPB-type domain-containing protein n=1 Tax=Cordylochernes scorpioides TaxID=51811 RepID=A0ABY6LSH2_9ARAC|nr:hypothetical protein LAZ67_22000835 [Cordylochernes scorpioides]